MIELRQDTLRFSFPEVHERARCEIHFQRTLRIPDDGRRYPLPPGLGSFPLRHVDDHGARVPAEWIRHGGVMLPMYQSEALWIAFRGAYPFAVKVATGKSCAVSGEEWSEGLHADPQDYVTIPRQPWLDGYCVEKGTVRQFVAMPLGSGYTAEEQLTGEARHGGIQIQVHPMKRQAYEEMMRRTVMLDEVLLSASMPAPTAAMSAAPDMGLAPGGRMRQQIFPDPHDLDVWDLEATSRCFVHIANSMVWKSITGAAPPTTPPTAREYSDQGLPWFDYYGGDEAVEGSSRLRDLLSVVGMGSKKGEVPLPENESVDPDHVVDVRTGLRKDQVREGTF